MLDVWFDNYSSAFNGSAFKLVLPSVPRAGDAVRVHLSRLPKHLKEGPNSIHDCDGYGVLIVKGSEFQVEESGACRVEINFVYEDEATGTIA